MRFQAQSLFHRCDFFRVEALRETLQGLLFREGLTGFGEAQFDGHPVGLVFDDTLANALWHATVPPGGGPPAHIHRPEIEIFYTLSGTIRFFDGETAMYGNAGMTLITSRGNQRRFVNRRGENAEVLILVTPTGLEEIFFKIGKPWTHRGPIAPPDDHERLLLIELAPSFGIELGH